MDLAQGCADRPVDDLLRGVTPIPQGGEAKHDLEEVHSRAREIPGLTHRDGGLCKLADDRRHSRLFEQREARDRTFFAREQPGQRSRGCSLATVLARLLACRRRRRVGVGTAPQSAHDRNDDLTQHERQDTDDRESRDDIHGDRKRTRQTARRMSRHQVSAIALARDQATNCSSAGR